VRGRGSTQTISRSKNTRSTETVAAARNLKTVVSAQLESLLCLENKSYGNDFRVARIFDLFTQDSLNRPALPPFDGLSYINADGLPFQWVLSFRTGSHAWGFLCECGRPGSEASTRLGLTLRLIDEACKEIGRPPPNFLACIEKRLIPNANELWPPHWRSAAWVGVAVERDKVSIKPYFSLTSGTLRDRWLKAGWVLRDLGRDDALRRYCELVSCCSRSSSPTAIAVDIQPDGSPGKLKIYFRSEAVTAEWLASWYCALDLDRHGASLRLLLDRLGKMGAGTYPPSAFVTSLEIHANQSLSLKTDLAVTKWMTSDAKTTDRTAALLSSEGCESERLVKMLDAVGAWPADCSSCAAFRFVGLGCEPNGSRHINVYIEPPLASARTHAHRPRVGGKLMIRRSIERGLDALAASRQGAYWRDFMLPVGSSDAWVTAYVLAKLAVGAQTNLAARRDLIGPSLDWLAGQQRTKIGGWGYNGDVPNDADSTAWAILALRGWGRDVPQTALNFLRFCRRDRGFATYPAAMSPLPGWACVAPCVSAVAFHALGEPTGSAHACFSRWTDNSELIPAYWWASPIYTSAMILSFSDLAPSWVVRLREKVAAFRPAGAFERALLLECHIKLGLPVAQLACDLIAEQGTSGVFAPSALLRLTRSEVSEPWGAIDAGPLYVDAEGVFTTATAVGVLLRLG
jgi:hypothetical protein